MAKKNQASEGRTPEKLQVEEKVNHIAEDEAGKDAGCGRPEQKERVATKQDQAAGCVTPLCNFLIL